MAPNYLFTQKVLSVVRIGSSQPIIAIDSHGNTVIIKLNGGLSSPSAAISDWIARKIGLEIGLPVIEPKIIIVDERADVSLVDSEIKDLLRKSHGLNSCSHYFEMAQDIDLQSVQLPTLLRERLFIFDLFLLNIDRSLSNSNLLRVVNSVYSIDYEASFIIMGTLKGTTYFENESVMKALRQNPLYQSGISLEVIEREFTTLQKVDVQKIINSIPEQWLSMFQSTEAGRKILFKSLTEHINNKEQYIELFNKLSSIEFITEQERKRRNLENRNIFSAKYTL